jgi:hypothetical protein
MGIGPYANRAMRRLGNGRRAFTTQVDAFFLLTKLEKPPRQGRWNLVRGPLRVGDDQFRKLFARNPEHIA